MTPDELRELADWFIQNHPYDNTARAIRAAADAWENESGLKARIEELERWLEEAQAWIRLITTGEWPFAGKEKP